MTTKTKPSRDRRKLIKELVAAGPGASIVAVPGGFSVKIPKSKSCECQLFGSVQMCAMHAAAPLLLGAVIMALKIVPPDQVFDEERAVLRHAVAKARGK